MEREEVEKYLEEKDVKPTANRILVLKELMKASNPVNLADLEMSLDTMDKASIFRVLELFADKEIVHVIEDGSRSVKYELCGSHTHHSIFDQHVHFYCEKCKATYCIEEEKIPVINVPAGFSVRSVNYVLKGLCPNCS